MTSCIDYQRRGLFVERPSTYTADGGAADCYLFYRLRRAEGVP